MIFAIFIALAFILISYVGTKAYLDHTKKSTLTAADRSKAAINNLYIFLAALTTMCIALVFQDGKVDTNDALYLFQFLVIAGLFGAVIVKEKNKFK